tara:strand:+ start:304 stop:510 length:207 start_codon:yes stop_codon:yes gene_type:complete
MKTTTKTIKIFSNTEIIALNSLGIIKEKYKNITIDSQSITLMTLMANEVIKQMEKNNLTTYKGELDNN